MTPAELAQHVILHLAGVPVLSMILALTAILDICVVAPVAVARWDS